MDKNLPNPVDGKVEDHGRQAEDVRKTSPRKDAISTVAQENKTETFQTEPTKTELAKTEANKTEVAKSKVAQTELAKTEANKTEIEKADVNKTEIDKADVNKTEFAKTEVAQTELAKTEANKTEIDKADMNKTEFAKTEVAQTELGNTETDKQKVAKVAKTEIAKAEVDKTEVTKAVTTQPETIKADTKLLRTEPDVAKTQLASGPEVAEVEPEVNKTTSADPEHVSIEPDSGETGLARTEAKGNGKVTSTSEPLGSGSSAGSSLGSPLGSTATRTRYSIESDSEISEILRDAPPPTVWEEEGDDGPSEPGGIGAGGTGTGGGGTGSRGTGGRGTGGRRTGGGESAGDEETVIIMKKTFTESVMPDQEFIPISEDSGNDHTRHDVLHLDTITVIASLSPQSLETTDGGHVENGTKTVPEPERTSDDENVLSKAQMEARDLTSEFRRLQYLLENLSEFSDLELAPPGEPPAPQKPAEKGRDEVPEPSTRKTEPEVEGK